MSIEASIIGQNFVVAMVNGVTHTLNSDHINYTAVRQALRNKDHEQVERLINLARAVENYVAGKITVRGDQIFYGDEEIKGSVVNRILAMLREGFDADPMIQFLENLMNNPSKRAVDELYGFLEASALPITEDGCFLAYKKVNNNYMDLYTGSVCNKLATEMSPQEIAALPATVGNVTIEIVNGVTTLSMPRNRVDEDKNTTCSHGLHFCSLSYLPYYYGGQGRVMIVKINPADVVAIPSDYNNAKGRACRYEVISEHTSETTEAFNTPVWIDDADKDADDFYNEKNEYDDWDAGYADGEKAAKLEQGQPYNNEPVFPRSEEYNDGYRLGYQTVYEENYVHVDWYTVGYEQAEQDVMHNAAYDDGTPNNCGDAYEYGEGYANGWRDAKVNRL